MIPSSPEVAGGAVDGVDLLTTGKQGHLEVVQTLEDGPGTMAVTNRVRGDRAAEEPGEGKVE